MTERLDWSDVTEKMARQILTQGETFMQAQLQVGLASDQRATTTASILATVATAIVAGALAYWDKDQNARVLWTGLTGAALLLIGSFFAAWSARPVSFYFPGNQPEHWYASRRDRFVDALGSEAENYQERINLNEETLADNHRALKFAIYSAIAAPVGATVVWLTWPLLLDLCARL